MIKNSKLLVLVTLVLLSPQLSAGGRAICLPHDAQVSEFLQAALLKQLQAEYIANLTNTSYTNLNNPQLSQIQNTILKIEANNKQIDKTLKQILQKLNMSIDGNGYPPSSLLHSCEEIKTQYPNSLSDYYTIIDGTGHARHVYCEMGQVCGSSGWTRMAYLNMSDPTEECPSGFRLYSQNGVRACGRPVTSGASCQSVRFPSYSISYSQVCGRVYGYQKGSPDAFIGSNLNGFYADGISITRGNPRKHMWTFVASIQANFVNSVNYAACPCATGSTQTSPSFVGSDYFCESGCQGHYQNSRFYYADCLWDGEQCGAVEGGCCGATVTGLPWFHKTLTTSTSDYIELRLCCDEGTSVEDVPVGLYEIYVK